MIAVPGSGFAEKLPVFVSILPQRHFVQQIGRDLVDVQVMVEPGASPHNYEPKPRQMVALSKARIYFAIGAPFEAVWLDRISAANPEMTIVRTDAGIEKIPMTADHHHEAEIHAETGAHNGTGSRLAGGRPADSFLSGPNEHEEGGTPDPHIWLSPPLVRILAGHILSALKTADPVNGDRYERNHADFVREVDDLHADLQEFLADKAGTAFMVFHPSWGYFARTYGLRQIPIEIEGKEPKPAQLRQLITHARAEGIRIVFVQPQFSRKSASTIARAIGGEVVFTDSLAPDWAENLRRQAEQFEKALR
ncbi:MAG: metal ABC transporter solute-binding protein, Zn/Mn family [Desulfobacterales bacterium]